MRTGPGRGEQTANSKAGRPASVRSTAKTSQAVANSKGATPSSMTTATERMGRKPAPDEPAAGTGTTPTGPLTCCDADIESLQDPVADYLRDLTFLPLVSGYP